MNNYNHLIIGSSFASIGALLALIKKRQKNIGIVIGKKIKTNEKLSVNLFTKNIKKYKDNINSGKKINNLKFPKNSNFFNYLGPGGNSNLWGKVMNVNVDSQISTKMILKNKLNIKNNIKLYENKNLLMSNFYDSELKPIDMINKFSKLKKIKLIRNKNVISIKYEKKKNIYKVTTENNVITTKKIYIGAGFFASIKLAKDIIGINNLKDKIKVYHKKLVYGLFLTKKNLEKKYYNESVFFLKKEKFYGRLAFLSKSTIKKHNLSFVFLIIYYFSRITKINIFLFNYFISNDLDTFINMNKNCEIKYSKKNNKKLKIEKKKFEIIFKNRFNYFLSFFIDTKPGTDFHYSTNIYQYMKKSKNNNLGLKNLVLLSPVNKILNTGFPTFKIICNAYENTIKILKNDSRLSQK